MNYSLNHARYITDGSRRMQYAGGRASSTGHRARAYTTCKATGCGDRIERGTAAYVKHFRAKHGTR